MPDGEGRIALRVIVCEPGAATTPIGFALAGDLTVGRGDPVPVGCRPAIAGEVVVRLEQTSADGLPASTALARTGVDGTVALTVPVGAGVESVNLSAMSAGGEVATTVALRSGRAVALDLAVAEWTATAADRSATGSAGSGWAAGSVDRVPDRPAWAVGWAAVAGVLLAPIVLVAGGLRRRRR